MSGINLNGRIIPAEEPFAGIHHRGLKYGDGLFESIRMLDGKMPLLANHLRRLFRGMKYLKIEKPNRFNTAFFRKEIKKLTGPEQNTRIRISVFRASGGLYTPTNNEATYLIEYQTLKSNHWEWKKKGLMTKVCPVVQLPVTAWSGLKTTNALPYVLAGLWKKSQKIDDCILCNQRGFIAEAGSSNIFYYKNKSWFTPSDRSGAIQGVMRDYILKSFKNNSFSIIKKDVLPKDLLEADEAFVTNAVQGIRWIREIDGVRFGNQETKNIWNLFFGPRSLLASSNT